MNKSLRPVEVCPTTGGDTGRVFKAWFHRWADRHQRVGDRELGGPAAIIEKKDGTVLLVDLGHASIKFTDVGPQEKLEDVRCETCGLGRPKPGCEYCGGTGWAKRVVPPTPEPSDEVELLKKTPITKGHRSCEYCGETVFLGGYARHLKECSKNFSSKTK